MIAVKEVKTAYPGLQAVSLKTDTVIEPVKWQVKGNIPRVSKGTMKSYLTTGQYLQKFIGKKFDSSGISPEPVNDEFAVMPEGYIWNNPINTHDPIKEMVRCIEKNASRISL